MSSTWPKITKWIIILSLSSIWHDFLPLPRNTLSYWLPLFQLSWLFSFLPGGSFSISSAHWSHLLFSASKCWNAARLPSTQSFLCDVYLVSRWISNPLSPNIGLKKFIHTHIHLLKFMSQALISPLNSRLFLYLILVLNWHFHLDV